MRQLKLYSIIILSALAFVGCGNTSGTSESTSIVSQQPAVQNVDQTRFETLKADSTVVIIDVRTPGEVQQGYIDGTDKFIDFNSPNFETQINALDKSTTYVVYCRSGNRSGQAAQYMVNNGFTSVYNLNGGIMRYTGTIAR